MSLDVRRVLSILRSWWPLLVATVVLAAGAALAVSSVSPKVYLGRATLIVGESASGTLPDYAQILAAQRLARTYETLATTRPVLETVRERLDLEEDVEELSRLVDASSPTESQFLIISAESLDPAEAAAIANAIADEVVAASSGLVTLVDPAVAPNAPISPRPLVNVAVATFVGLLIAAGLAFAVELLNERFKTADDVRETLGLPTLGEITRMRWDRKRPDFYGLATIVFPRSPAAEAYRALRTNIEFAAVDAPLRSVLVTSAVPGEGKTITAANLAVAFAQAGRRVLLVDADFRRPSVDQLFGIPNIRGLTTMFRDDRLSVVTVAQRVEQENLEVLTTGPMPPNPSELLGSLRMRSILAHLEATYDLVIFDSPPVRAVTDAPILSAFIGGTLLVVDAVVSRQGTVRHTCEALRKANANLLGVVLNRLPERSFSAYHNYHSDERALVGEPGRPGAVAGKTAGKAAAPADARVPTRSGGERWGR